MTSGTEPTAELLARRLGDDALIYGQRLAEWCSRGPTLEEDLALTSVALDYIGRARMYYDYAGSFSGMSEDDYAYTRDLREFSNLLLYELPNGDFAFTMVRQYLIDEFESLYLGALAAARDEQLAAIAAKARKETDYHLRRSREWMRRLGRGTDESARRGNVALSQLWGYLPEFFAMDPAEAELVTVLGAPDRTALEGPWRSSVATVLADAGLTHPEDDWVVSGGRAGVHTEHLGTLLAELQFMQRAYPGLEW